MIAGLRWLAHRSAARAIVSHFQCQLPPRGERRLRAHLRECGVCRALYDTQLLLESGPGATRARRDRLEAALFPREEARSRPVLRLAAGLATAVLLLAGAMFWLRPPASGLREKGLASGPLAASRQVSVIVYTRPAAAPRQGLHRVEQEVWSGQPLAFAYSNHAPEGFDRLLLFAVDETYTVYWFYPAWTDPAAIPAGSYPIGSGDRELPEQIAHRFEGDRLWLVALFMTRRDLGVREVEAAVEGLRRRGDRMDTLTHFPLAETGQHILSLRVRRP